MVNDLPPRSRNISMVFQSYALYPHMTVRENLGFSLKIAGAPKEEMERRVAEASAILGLDPLLERRPSQLSGGQRQRVAMGRAIVRDPDVFLFDEPLSNLDAKLRTQMRTEIKKLHAKVQLDGDLRHPRPGRGDDAVRPHRHHARRLYRAGRHAGRGVPAAGDALRRRLHRLAADEPGRGDGRRRPAGVRQRRDAAAARPVQGQCRRRPTRSCSGCGPTTSTRPAMASIPARRPTSTRSSCRSRSPSRSATRRWCSPNSTAATGCRACSTRSR